MLTVRRWRTGDGQDPPGWGQRRVAAGTGCAHAGFVHNQTGITGMGCIPHRHVNGRHNCAGVPRLQRPGVRPMPIDDVYRTRLAALIAQCAWHGRARHADEASAAPTEDLCAAARAYDRPLHDSEAGTARARLAASGQCTPSRDDQPGDHSVLYR